MNNVQLGPLAIAIALGTSVAASAQSSQRNSRVFVSTTLNNSIHVLDAKTLQRLQPPIQAKGAGPVRMHVGAVRGPQTPGTSSETDWVTRSYLFSANHGVVGSSVGVYDLSQSVVTELPASPFFTGALGAVAVTTGAAIMSDPLGPYPMVFVTNATQALGGCGMPKGSLTGFSAVYLHAFGVLIPGGHTELDGVQPWGVAINESSREAYVALNCDKALQTVHIDLPDSVVDAAPFIPPPEDRGVFQKLVPGVKRPLPAGPDGTLYDAARERSYTVSISGGTLTVYDATSPTPLTTVPLKNDEGGTLGPIEANFADSPGFEKSWLVTANGRDDSISLIDRDIIEACIAAESLECPEAEVGRIGTGVPGGAPEGIDYDPVSERVFVVNKALGRPSLSVIELTGLASADGGDSYSVEGGAVADVPLGPIGLGEPAPALIAFDVVVEPGTAPGLPIAF